MEKECVINPKTGRAVVAKGKIGRQVLKKQVTQPVKAKKAPKPKEPPKPKEATKPKEPNTMYKKPIGPVKPKKVKPKINTLEDLQKELKKIAKEHPELNFMDYTIFEADKFMDKLNKIDNRITYKIIQDIFDQRNIDWVPFIEKLFVGPVKPKKVNTMYDKPIGPVKPKEANTQYKNPWEVRPNKYTKLTYEENMRKDRIDNAIWARRIKNSKEYAEADRKKVMDSFKNLVNEWDMPTIGILFGQISNDAKRTTLQNMRIKIMELTWKKKAIIPSELFAFLDIPIYGVNENLLDLLVDKYGADKKGIDIIDEGMRTIIKYVEPEAILPDEIDYNYYSKRMNAKNRAKMAKMITEKYFKKK